MTLRPDLPLEPLGEDDPLGRDLKRAATEPASSPKPPDSADRRDLVNEAR
ncbi:MAG: hypothetical protein ACYTGU_21225 [Planctomycetota bacterium]